MTLRLVTCHRCGHEWATKVKPKRCASCRTPYWKKSRGDEPPEVIRRHPTLSNEELDAVLEAARLEKLTYEAERLAKAAGLTVERWLAQATPEARETYKHVPEVLALWERVDGETRERSGQYGPIGPEMALDVLLPSRPNIEGPDPDRESGIRRKAAAAQELFQQQTGILL